MLQDTITHELSNSTLSELDLNLIAFFKSSGLTKEEVIKLMSHNLKTNDTFKNSQQIINYLSSNPY
jgi:histidyl-tRNA synthetase